MKRTLLSAALAAFSLAIMAQTTYAPVLEVNFRTAAGNTAWQYAKDAAEEGNTNFEGNYFAGIFVLQKYTVPNIQNATSLTLTLTDVGTTGVDGTMLWSYPSSDWDASASVDDVVAAITSVVGVAPRSSEGELNSPLATGKKVADSDPKQGYFTISGAALQTVKASATEDGTFTLMITDKNLLGNSSRKFFSSNTANAEALRPTLSVTAEEPTVVNTTTGVSYKDLNEAFAAAVAADEDAVLEVSADQKLSGRLTWNVAHSISIIPTRDITIKGPKNAMWFLANKNDATMTIGSNDYKMTFDGIEDDREPFNNSHVVRRENTTKLYLTNIEFRDFNCGANSLIGCKNAGGGIYLEDITITHCTCTDAFISNLREQNDALYIKGYLNVEDCTGTTIYTAKNRIRLGNPEENKIYDDFSATNVITIAWGGEFAEGTPVVVKVPGTAADKFQLVSDEWKLMRKTSNGDMLMVPMDYDAIRSVATDGSAPATFDLGGRQIDNASPRSAQRGIAIVGGKKVLVK